MTEVNGDGLARRLPTRRDVWVGFGGAQINFPGFGGGNASRPKCGYDLISGFSREA